MRWISRHWLALTGSIIVVVLVIPAMWIAIANGGGSSYLAKVPAVVLGLAIFIALVNLFGYLILDLRVRRLRTRAPNSLFATLIGQDDTMAALADGNVYAAAAARPYVVEVTSEGSRFWRRFNQPIVFAVIPRETIIRMGLQPGRLGVRRATALAITVRTRAGERDIPLYLAGDGLGMLVSRSPAAIERLMTEMGSKLHIDVLPSQQ
ncbi:hypothetical protein ACPPVQ_02430 [Diaminobutyricibacter sp. McL0618]|uniref:hypothetical protein n=1 Tax=Leifsonia sp. McL0618 TaxID=3415677 RepID=UPI003CED4CAE